MKKIKIFKYLLKEKVKECNKIILNEIMMFIWLLV